jgi:hypothetical protein
VTALPAALSRWRQQLQLLPDDLAAELGRLILSLAPAVDSVSRSEQDPSGDVDGFDGIANRGSYERLLASEWLLSRTAPLEFLRRATAGEQSFLRLAHRKPAQPERTLVLFDAGPDQLGGCRIVQLALLVLLVQRCESQGRQLRWQLMHHQGDMPLSTLDESSVRAFLQGRTGLRMAAPAVASWLQRYAGERIWLIGGRAATRHGASAFARLTLKEGVAREAPAVDVLLERGAEQRRVALLLPQPDHCARLLRDPFEQARPQRAVVPAIDGGVLLSAPGSRLFYCTQDGAIVAVPVPNSPGAPLGKPRSYRSGWAGHVVCGVGGRGRRVVWLSHANGQLRIGHATSSPRKAVLTASGPQPAKPSPLAWFGEETAYYATPERALWIVDFRTQRARCFAEGVRAWLQTGQRDIVAVDRVLDAASQGPQVLELNPYSASTVLHNGYAWQEAHLSSGQNGRFTLALSNGDAWRVEDWRRMPPGEWRRNASLTLYLPRGSTVLGVEAHAVEHRLPGLWLLESSRREVSIARRGSSRGIVKTDATIEHAHLASNGSVLALRTSEGELLVVSAAGKMLYRASASS